MGRRHQPLRSNLISVNVDSVTSHSRDVENYDQKLMLWDDYWANPISYGEYVIALTKLSG